jgi:hypothetical protein
VTFNVIASRVYEGSRKDGTRYHWCSVWIPLDDGSLYEIKSFDRDYQPGTQIELYMISRFGKLDLVPPQTR